MVDWCHVISNTFKDRFLGITNAQQISSFLIRVCHPDEGGIYAII